MTYKRYLPIIMPVWFTNVCLCFRLGNIQSRLGPKRRRPDSGDEEDALPRKVIG